MKKKPLIIIGGGGHCKSCIDVIEQENRFDIVGIIDMPERIGEKVLSYSIIGSDSDLEKISKSYSNFFIALGQIRSCEKRVSIFTELIKLGVNIPSLISPFAYVSKHAKIGIGTIIMHHAVINVGAIVGDNCIINTKALLEHDVIIGKHCHISTGAIINGGVKVGDGSFYGSGAVSKEYIDIPAYSFTKANSIVK